MNIAYWHYRTGETTLKLELYPLTSGAIANGAGGDAFSEPSAGTRPGYYEATVSQSLTGLHIARILKGSAVIGLTIVEMAATGTIVLGSGLPVSLSSSTLAQLTGTLTINHSVPALVNNALDAPLIRGDCYLAEHDRALTFSRADFPDLVGDESVTLTARMTNSQTPYDPPTITLSGSVSVASGTKVVSFDITSAESAAWEIGTYEFDVEIEVASGKLITFVGPEAELRVIEDITVPEA